MDEDQNFDPMLDEDPIYPGDDEDEVDSDFNVFDEEGQRSRPISEGFAAPVEYDDPFGAERTPPSGSQRNSRGGNSANEPIITTLFPKPANAGKDPVSFDVKPQTKPSTDSQKKKKQGPGKKGKPFKVIKAQRSRSIVSDESVDPEEEKLKLLPDCCEFTVRRNTLEIDEGRKEMSSAWFSLLKLTPAEQKHLCFSESLLMVEETGNVVGKYYCTITDSKWNDKPCFCVHSGSSGKFTTGLESGTSITSFLSYNLKPLQEFVHEWATLDSDTIERKTFFLKEDLAVSCKILLIRNGKTLDNKVINLGLKERENLVTEGMNLLLQRLLILEKRTIGKMNVQSLSFTGKVVRAKYGELGTSWENVRGKQMKTWGIRRTVFVTDGEERTWDSLYNKNARLILRCQPDSPQALIPLWFESIIEFDKHDNFIGSYSPYVWACDAELYSKYVIRKEEITHSHRRYILDHPEVRALLSDYLQSLLFKKPQNVLEFTKQYFESFLYLRVKPTKTPSKKALETVSGTSSQYIDDSTVSLLEEDTLGEGEWLGEGEDGDASSYYVVSPTVNYDGLEKVDDHNPTTGTESDPFTTENETEDDLVVNERGQYIRSVK